MVELIYILALNLAWLVTAVFLYFEAKHHKQARALLDEAVNKLDNTVLNMHAEARSYQNIIKNMEYETKRLYAIIENYKLVIAEQNKKLLRSQPKKKTKKGKKNVRHA
jgi:hypothetical protein